ncbi:MAG TPA: class I SAM-dependent methyltransferase [Streptosporangiaceae bacterium]|nr:class I SAM-dependent methyltransferase [Streptosporangiaceae bacterium]
MDLEDWRGIAETAIRDHGAQHNPVELGALLHLMEGHAVGITLEIGAARGGSAWAWSQVPSVRKIVTVDARPRPGLREVLADLPCEAILIEGDSTVPSTWLAVEAALDGEAADAVVIDGGHDYATVRRDWFWYGQMCRAEGMVIFHDTQDRPGTQVRRLFSQVREWRTLEISAGPLAMGAGIAWVPRGLPDARLAQRGRRRRYYGFQHRQLDRAVHSAGHQRVHADSRVRGVQDHPDRGGTIGQLQPLC